MSDKKYKKAIEIDDQQLDKISGGRNFGTYKSQKKYWPLATYGKIMLGWMKQNTHYDPGTLFQMRVYFKDCGFFGCRDGSDDDRWGNEIEYSLYRDGLVKYN